MAPYTLTKVFNNITVRSFFHQESGTWTHLIHTTDKQACLIDPCLNYNMYSATISTTFIDTIIQIIQSENLQLHYILETHTHADHLTASRYIQSQLQNKVEIGISQHIVSLLDFWKDMFEFSSEVSLSAQHFDLKLKEEQTLKLGSLKIAILETPGHTPCGLTFQIEQALFIGDTLFYPQIGTARTDFPGGSSEVLYNSIQKIYKKNDENILFLCHDYPQPEHPPQAYTTIKEQKQKNILLSEKTEKQHFIHKRDNKNNPNNVPRLIWPALHFNLSLGHLPTLTHSKKKFISIPINTWETF